MRKVKDVNLLALRFSSFPSLFPIVLSFNLPVVTAFIAIHSCQDFCGVVVTTCLAGKNPKLCNDNTLLLTENCSEAS